MAPWELLIELAREFGQDELVEHFTQVLAAEERHEATVTAWMSAALAAEAGG